MKVLCILASIALPVMKEILRDL